MRYRMLLRVVESFPWAARISYVSDWGGNKLKDETYLPHTQELDKKVGREPSGEHLADNEHVRGQRALQHNGHVARIEQFDGIAPPLAPKPIAFHRDLDPEALQVNDNHDDGRDEVHDVR